MAAIPLLHPEGLAAPRTPERARAAEAATAARPPETLESIASLFRMFGDPTRLAILYALSADELCVRDIARAVGLSQSAASHQLAILRAAGLARARREGKTMYYRLDDGHVGRILDIGAEHAGERE